MPQEILPKYRCTEQELYAVASLAIDNLESELTAMGAYKPKYDAAYVTAARAKLTAAKALPDVEVRNSGHQTSLNLLKMKGFTCTENYPLLQGYIEDAWENEDPKPRFQAAGGVKYRTATRGDWEDLSGMNDAMVTFIADNNASLTAGGMPVAFATKVTDDATKFAEEYAIFKSAMETSVGQQQKIVANNDLVDLIMGFMKDAAERVFRGDEAKRELFMFKKLKQIVSPPRSASVTIKIKQANDLPAANAAVTIKQDGEPAMTGQTDANGELQFKNIDPGNYDGTVLYNAVSTGFNKDVNTGVNARITILLGA